MLGYNRFRSIAIVTAMEVAHAAVAAKPLQAIIDWTCMQTLREEFYKRSLDAETKKHKCAIAYTRACMRMRIGLIRKCMIVHHSA